MAGDALPKHRAFAGPMPQPATDFIPE